MIEARADEQDLGSGRHRDQFYRISEGLHGRRDTALNLPRCDLRFLNRSQTSCAIPCPGWSSGPESPGPIGKGAVNRSAPARSFTVPEASWALTRSRSVTTP